MNPRLEIEQSEEKLRGAMLAGDVDQLENMLGDAAIFTNQDGVRLSKADDLAAHRSGLLKIDKLDVRGEPIIRVIDNSAIVCVTIALAGSYGGEPFGGVFAYSRIWHRTGDRWQIEAAHCSAVRGV